MRRLAFLWLPVMTFALGTACGGGSGTGRKDPSKELGKLRQVLNEHRFKSVSARALTRTVALAKRSSAPESAEVWSQVSRSRLDWACMALLRQRPQLLVRLLKHLGLEASCAQQGRVAVWCIEPMVRGIAAGYDRARAIYDDESDTRQAGQAKRRVDLVHQVLLHHRLASPEAAEALRFALSDESYDIKRYAQLSVVTHWLRARRKKVGGPLSGPRLFGRAFPYPCPRAFGRLGSASPAQLVKALARCNCSTGCADPISGAARACKKVTTPMNPLTPLYATAQAAVAMQGLRMLVRVAREIMPKRQRGKRVYVGLQRVFRPQIKEFHRSVQELAVRLPYRPWMHVGKRRVTPPVFAKPLPESWESRAAVHLVVTNGGLLVGLTPVIGVRNGLLSLLNADAGYGLPGQRITISGSHHALRQALDKARTAATKKLRLGATGDGVALYIDHRVPMREVVDWVRRLRAARAKEVELLFGDGHTVARSIRARWLAKPTGEGHESLKKIAPKLTFGAWTTARLRTAQRKPSTPPTVTFTP